MNNISNTMIWLVISSVYVSAAMFALRFSIDRNTGIQLRNFELFFSTLVLVFVENIFFEVCKSFIREYQTITTQPAIIPGLIVAQFFLMLASGVFLEVWICSVILNYFDTLSSYGLKKGLVVYLFYKMILFPVSMIQFFELAAW